MNSYGLASCVFFDTYEDAVAAHDLYILYLSESLSTGDRDRFRKKLINKIDLESLKNPLEVRAVNWYEGLSTEEKENVSWLKHYYSKI